MRIVHDPQAKLGLADIADLVFDPKSRDDIDKLLRGLQHLYTTPVVRQRVFAILEEVLPDKADGSGKASPHTGRPGMTQWNILVLGVLRLGLDADYDRIHNLANQHRGIRQMLGHGDWDDPAYYELQTLKDNLRLFTPDLLDRINREVVGAGHAALKKKPGEGLALEGRCDSFVVETDVEYPTDLNLLYEAVRKAVETAAELSAQQGLPGWRQGSHLLRRLKKLRTRLQRLKRSTAKDEKKRQAREEEIRQACRDYLDMAGQLLQRLQATRQALAELPAIPLGIIKLDGFLKHVVRQTGHVRRRVLEGEQVPHGEKVFSIFQPHTEWISKGKAGVPVELGLKVCVVEDQHRFILHHHVMEKATDEQVAVKMVEEAKQRFPHLDAMSFDKGFHSKANQEELKKHLRQVVLPRKGRLSAEGKRTESDPGFVRLRRRHSAVESAINGLESGGLDRCPDHGIDGFKRYVALAVVARNLHRLGAVLRDQEQEKARRKRGPYKKAA
jgi:IS5 family transposase